MPPPQKWRKYELLQQFGLAETDYLRRTIQRFTKEDRDLFVAQLRQDVKAAEVKGELNLFVMKFVPKHLAMLLPNVRVQGLSDLPNAERAVREEPLSSYDEIWFCRTNVSAASFSVAGRVLVNSLDGIGAHTIEQVWRCSPRLIESLSDVFPFPFVRASRSGWGWSPTIEQIHIPQVAPETEQVVRHQFSESLRKLDREREKLETFVEAVLGVGLDVCCLEYKIEGDRMQIIDWDTGNDSFVIDRLMSNEGA